MHSALLLTHLIANGLWIGCILTEAAFEHRLPKGDPFEAAVARLHVVVDVWIETPAFLIVLATGLMLLTGAPQTPLFHTKIAFGLAAVAVNAWCVWLVFRRRALFAAGDVAGAHRADHIQHKAGGLLLVLILVALAIGAMHFAG